MSLDPIIIGDFGGGSGMGIIYKNYCIIIMFNKGGKFIRKYNQTGHIALLVFVSMLMALIPCSSADQAFSAMDLTYITEQFPPYNYQEDGKLQGISVDLLEKMWALTGVNLSRSSIKLLPWKEGYETTLKENNTVLFSTGRIPEREQLFKWVGPAVSGKYALLAKNDKNITIATPDDLKRYKIGTIENDMAVQMLLNSGLKKEDLIIETASKPIIEMLENGTIDAWAYSDITGIWQIQDAGGNASDYKVAYVLGLADAYYAFNKETPDSIVQSFQQALDYIKSNKDSNGVSDYEKTLTEYIPATYIGSITEQNEVISFLNEAVAYLKDNGKDKALQEFNNRSGSFVRGDLYIFAYDFNGTCIVHPINPDLVGQTGLSDINGVDVVSRELALARRGNGTMYIVFPNPTQGGKEEVKQLYIENVNNSLYLGSGLYLSNISASFDQEERDELVAYVDKALQFAKENGKEKALEVFNDPEGNFTRDGRYIFAYDYEGQNLALPYQPELVGTSRIDVQDPNGVYFIR
ncbi:MAG: cache domain-containing protein [Candidatus Bathyarchaeota archaeon]|nr:cache domain-containing protein [Candidatus Bathyarchaeota archaeon]